MLSFKERLNYLMIFCCFTCFCAKGSDEDLSDLCEIEIKVRRGMTRRPQAGKSVTVECPVKHCGKSLDVSWCKLDTNGCEPVNEGENVEITQKPKAGELISYLRFKHISLDDDGLYRCVLLGFDLNSISHTINVSVSEVQHIDDYADDSLITADNEAMRWLPYFFICAAFALMVAVLTGLTFLTFHGFYRTQTHSHSKEQEDFSHMTVKPSEGTLPSTSVLQTHQSIQNDIYSSWAAEPPPTAASTGNLPAADRIQVSNSVVYATINHSKSGIAAARQQATSAQEKSQEYAETKVA